METNNKTTSLLFLHMSDRKGKLANTIFQIIVLKESQIAYIDVCYPVVVVILVLQVAPQKRGIHALDMTG